MKKTAENNEQAITMDKVREIIGEHFENETKAGWHGLELNIKRSLSLSQMLEFAGNVVDSCFLDEGGFMPEVMDFAIKSNILRKYADFPLPENLEERYEIIYGCDIVEFVCRHIDMQQLNEMTVSIDRKIAHLCNTNAAEVRKRTEEVVAALESVQAQTAELFAGLKPEDLTKITAAFANGGFSEDRLVKAYIEQTRGAAAPEGA